MSKQWSLLRRSSALLLALVAPLVAFGQLTVGVERAAASPELETLARAGRVAIASSPTTFLAVWTDRRTDRGAEIVAARLDTAARILDPRGIALSSTPAVSEDHPLVAFDGVSSFVVVWAAGDQTMAAKVSATGVITTGPVAIATGRPESLTLNNRDLAIAIADDGDTTLSLLRSDLTLRFVTRIARVQNVEITALGYGFAIAWLEDEFSSGRTILRAMRIDSRREVVDTVTVSQLGSFEEGTTTFALGTFEDDAIIAAGSKDRLAVVRMDPDGTIVTLTTNTTVIPRSIEDVVTRLNGFDLLAIIDGRPRVIRFTGNAVTGENEPLAVAVEDGAGAFAERVFTIWQTGGVVMGRFAFVDQQEPAIIVSRSPVSQQLPALATDGAMVLAAWTEDTGEKTDRVVARLLALDGTPDPATRLLTIGNRTMTPLQSAPAMAFASNNYFISWTDQRSGAGKPAHLLMMNVNRRAVLGGTQQISATAHPTESPAMAAGPEDALVVWIDGMNAARRLRGALVSQTFTQFSLDDIVADPAVTGGDGGWVVAGATAGSGVRAVFVANDLTTRFLFDSAPPFGSTDTQPAVAWNGRGDYLLVFLRNGSVYARLLGADGTPRGDTFALVAQGINQNPRVAWDGHAFLVSWTSRTADDPSSDGDLWAMRVLTSGAAEAPVALSTTARNDDFASLLPLGDGVVLTAYQRMAAELQNVHRVFTRVVTGAPIRIPPGKRRSVR